MRRRQTQKLRAAIECLPVRTRVAMLEGIGGNEIIVGAYTDRRGGICPMLAAHRCGGRTDFLSFAKAWDGFTKAKRARRATERELLVLRSHLEASLLADAPVEVDLAASIAAHRELVARRRAAEPVRPARRSGPRPGDPDRSRELRRRGGWAWLRPFRRYDEYEAALELLEAERERVEESGSERTATPA
jgi:hypothetical protein